VLFELNLINTVSLKVLRPYGLALRITSLKEGVHEFSDNFPSAALDLSPEEFSDLSISLRIDLKTQQAFVSFEVSGVAHLICDRTLRPFEQNISGSYQVLFSDKAADLPEAERGEDLFPFPHSTLELNLTEPIRDTLLLAVPLRKVAPDAEEQEIKLSFGEPDDEDAATDPRWSALRRLNLSTDN